jgi:hypothetical protein
VLKLRKLNLHALRQAALACGQVGCMDEAAEPAAMTELVRSAIGPIATSTTGRCALVLLGLDPNTFDIAPNLLREDAAEIWGVSVERFRRDPQATVLGIVADKILERCVVHRERLARLALERHHPCESRLAVKWLERFEAYFRLWTPIYALGADLTAYRSTLLEEDRPWDRAPGTDGPDDPGYSQEMQAAGYGTDAFYRLACVSAEEKRFVAEAGGLWLLSSPEAEVAVRDALRDVTRYQPLNERDLSWLRAALDDASGELHPFLTAVGQSNIGRELHKEWQDWLCGCDCTWRDDKVEPEMEYFASARYHDDISPKCELHRVISACDRYCALIENEWIQVSDFYEIGRNR